jgi:anti-sigma B factor antagonist
MWQASDRNGVQVLSWTAALDSASASLTALRALEQRTDDAWAERTVIDISCLTALDSNGIATIIHIAGHCHSMKRKLALAAPQPLVARVLHAMHIARILPIHASLDEAVAALR